MTAANDRHQPRQTNDIFAVDHICRSEHYVERPEAWPKACNAPCPLQMPLAARSHPRTNGVVSAAVGPASLFHGPPIPTLTPIYWSGLDLYAFQPAYSLQLRFQQHKRDRAVTLPGSTNPLRRLSPRSWSTPQVQLDPCKVPVKLQTPCPSGQ